MEYAEKGYKFFLALYMFFIVSTISNAGRSIALGGVVLFAGYYWAKGKRTIRFESFAEEKRYWIVYGAFFGLLILAAFFAPTKTAIASTLKYLYWTLPLWVIYISGFFFPVHKLWRDAVALAVIVIGAFSVHQFICMPFGTRLSAPFANPNGLAGILELCLPFGALFVVNEYKLKQKKSKKEFWLNAVATTVALFVLLFTQSRGGIAGTFIGGIVLVAMKFWLKYRNNVSIKRKICIILMGIVLVTGVVFSGFILFHRAYDLERFLMIESSYHMWEDHKVFGVGLDNWGNEYKKYVSPIAKEPNLPMPHNNIAFFFSTTGIVGGLGYCVYVLGTLAFLLKKIRENPVNLYYSAAFWAFLAIVIHGMVDSGIMNKYQMQILSANLGVALSSSIVSDKD